jgi:hypothetical protein
VHTFVNCLALLGDISARLAKTGAVLAPFGREGARPISALVGFGSCWSACRLHLMCDALDVARNRSWRISDVAHEPAGSCAGACGGDDSHDGVALPRE